MSDLELEPYAVQQIWTMPRPLEPGEWATLFGEYLARLASACESPDPVAGAQRVVIGHIKLLALFSDHEYLRVSVVSARHAPTVAGAAPASLSEVSITLNLLVYGLPRERLSILASATAHALAGARAGSVHEQIPTESTGHVH